MDVLIVSFKGRALGDSWAKVDLNFYGFLANAESSHRSCKFDKEIDTSGCPIRELTSTK